MYDLKRGSLKRGQVTLFIILAIIIVGGFSVFLIFKENIFPTNIPTNFQAPYASYLSCLESITREGILLIGDNGGYIEKPDFVAGSVYTPFSSQLDFFGNGIPYWLYLSNNGSFIEQVPEKNKMEIQLEKYIKDRMEYCSFDSFKEGGYDIFVENGEVFVKIDKENVFVEVQNNLNMYYDEKFYSVNKHIFEVNSKLGKFYDIAKKVYDYEKTNMFLEKYTIDVLWNYAPVEEVNLECNNLKFSDSEIRKGLYEGLEANMNLIKLKGNYYDDSLDEFNGYYIADIGEKIDENINVMYNPDWVSRIEFYGDRNINPLSGVLNLFSFCFSSVHFVYDIQYPVLIQVWDEDLIFQFPISVVIEKNNPREPINSKIEEKVIISKKNACNYMDSKINVRTYDSEFNSIPANLTFKCIDSECNLGNSIYTDSGLYSYSGNIPRCVNGILTASSKGYSDSNFIISTTSLEKEVDIILYREYDLDIDVLGISSEDNVLLNFYGDSGYSTSVFYPELKSVKLKEDNYIINSYIYSKNKVSITESSQEYCTDAGVLHDIFGINSKKCDKFMTPSFEIERPIIGGGYINQYFTDEMLRNSKTLHISPTILGIPNSLESLQNNYINVESSRMSIDLI